MRLSAEVRDGVAMVSLSDGTNAVSSPIANIEHRAAGAVGLMHGDANALQSFDRFVAIQSPVLVEDPDLDRKLIDARGRYRGELKGTSWDYYARSKHILLDAYRPADLPFPGDWVLVLQTHGGSP